MIRTKDKLVDVPSSWTFGKASGFLWDTWDQSLVCPAGGVPGSISPSCSKEKKIN